MSRGRCLSDDIWVLMGGRIVVVCEGLNVMWEFQK